MNPFEEMETGLEIIQSKLVENMNETIKIFYDFEAVDFKEFLQKEDIDFSIETCLEIQKYLKITRATIDAYVDAREVYLECLGMSNEKSLKNTPLVKKGEP